MFTVGELVDIHSLSRSDYTGQRGIIKSEMNKKGRYAVEVLLQNQNKKLLIRPGDLRRIHTCNFDSFNSFEEDCIGCLADDKDGGSHMQMQNWTKFTTRQNLIEYVHENMHYENMHLHEKGKDSTKRCGGLSEVYIISIIIILADSLTYYIYYILPILHMTYDTSYITYIAYITYYTYYICDIL
jgi:hypothetical protein